MGACISCYINTKLNNCTDNIPKFSLQDYKGFCKVVNFYDGDTFRGCIWLHNRILKFTFRTYDYDAPEIKQLKSNPNRNKEKKLAIKARDDLRTFILNKLIYIHCGPMDKYGRVLVFMYLNKKSKISINQLMLETSCVLPYDGGKKKSHYNNEYQ